MLVYIGLISFPLYMWHWPLLTFTRILESGKMSTFLIYFVLSVTVLLSIATYHLVEQPIRTRRHWRGTRAMALVSLVAGCGLAGYLIFAEDGIEGRYQQAQVSSPARLRVANDHGVALIGDSNAGQFASALGRIYGAQLKMFATPGWPYLAGAVYTPEVAADPSLKGTPQRTTEAIEAILADPKMDTVIIAHSYLTYVIQDNLRSYPSSPPGETSAEAYEKGLRRTAELLSDAGKTVIYVKTIPIRFDADPVIACGAAVLPIARRRPETCEIATGAVQAQRTTYNTIVSRALEGLAKVYVFVPLPYLCDEHVCSVQKNSVVQYRDPTHLNEAGAEMVGLPLVEFMESKRSSIDSAMSR